MTKLLLFSVLSVSKTIKEKNMEEERSMCINTQKEKNNSKKFACVNFIVNFAFDKSHSF